MYENTPATPYTPRLTMASKETSRTSDSNHKNEDISWVIPDLTASVSSMCSSQSEFDRLAADFPLIYDESCDDNEFDVNLSSLFQTESRVQNKASCFVENCELRNDSICESDEESIISALTTPYLSRSPILCATQCPETILKRMSLSPTSSTPRTAKGVYATEDEMEIHAGAKGALFIQLTQVKGCVKMAAQKIVHAVQQDQTNPESEPFKADPMVETRSQSGCSFGSDSESVQSICWRRVGISHESPSRFADLTCWGQDSHSGSRTVSV